MRRRLQNQTTGDPAADMISARDAQLQSDVARFPRLQPEIVSRRQRERVTQTVIEFQERQAQRFEYQGPAIDFENGGTNPGFQGTGAGLSSRAGALPPSPPAPKRETLSLPRKTEGWE